MLRREWISVWTAAVTVLAAAGTGGCHLPMASAMAVYGAATRKEIVRWDVEPVSVESGCVLEVRHGDTPVTIELDGVLCPAEGEPFSRESADFTRRLVTDTKIVVELTSEPDKTRPDPAARQNVRQNVRLFLPDGKNLAHLLVGEGLAWWIPKNPPDDPALEKLARDAHTARKGVWSNPKAVPPWYRQK